MRLEIISRIFAIKLFALCFYTLCLLDGTQTFAKGQNSQTQNQRDGTLNKPNVEVLTDAGVISELNLNGSNDKIESNELEILIWNIYKGSKNNIYEDLFTLLQGKALVLLQEGYDDNNFRSFLNAVRNYNWIMASSFLDNNNIRTGVITASLQQPSFYKFLRSPVREPILGTPKMSLASYYNLTAIKGVVQKLLVINIHAINFVTLESFKKHIQQNFDLIATHNGPVLFAGDFNTWSSGRMVFLNEMAAKYGLNYVRFTGNDQSNLDHIYQRGFAKASATIHRYITSSDHSPITLNLRLGNNIP